MASSWLLFRGTVDTVQLGQGSVGRLGKIGVGLTKSTGDGAQDEFVLMDTAHG